MASQQSSAAGEPAAGEEFFDVVVIGAGLSGVGMAAHLRRELPELSVCILEGREDMGGTWDLFKYPGIRSDSDMLTLGYSFRPWTSTQTLAGGADILQYVKDTAEEYDLKKQCRFGCHVTGASWSSETTQWTVELANSAPLRCSYLVSATGYYDYENPHNPSFAGSDNFRGQVIHPQFWPEGLDYQDKQVVVIGSGATAVTLVPAMAEGGARHVTMLQRSPTYCGEVPSTDWFLKVLLWIFPLFIATWLGKVKNTMRQMMIFHLSKWKPRFVASLIRRRALRVLGPDYDYDTHFSPRYNPWDQRVCAVPDSDLFHALRGGKASVVTDTIDRFTETGIRTTSGQEIPADIIVTATGLQMKMMGGMKLSVDGDEVKTPTKKVYRGMMLTDVPNYCYITGYTNASWTLKADLVSEYWCRLLKHCRAQGLNKVVPRWPEDRPGLKEVSAFNLTSGYLTRSAHLLPKQGSERPWFVGSNVFTDALSYKFGSLTQDLECSSEGAASDAKKQR